MNKFLVKLLAMSAVSFIFSNTTNACTDFRLTAKDGTTLITRSMEFSADLKSNLRNTNRGTPFHSTMPNGKAGLSWKAKYGYLFVDGFNQNFVVDGMNENGLSFEYLYLPGETAYQAIPAGKENQALPYYQFGDWILGSFSTIAEVKKALSNIYVVQANLQGLGTMVFPVHASIYDKTGKGIVVEFVNGKMNIFDNIGILTNSPTYHWQVVNLRNYLNLSPYSPQPITANGITFSATGQGAGMVGLPGDVSPPSRFVKMSFLAKVAYSVDDATGVLNLAEHLINNVDIPAGLSRAIDNGKESSETTEWVVFKDLTHKIFYYRTYNDMTIRAVTLDKIDFSASAPKFIMPLSGKPYLLDVTDEFLKAKS